MPESRSNQERPISNIATNQNILNLKINIYKVINT